MNVVVLAVCVLMVGFIGFFLGVSLQQKSQLTNSNNTNQTLNTNTNTNLNANVSVENTNNSANTITVVNVNVPTTVETVTDAGVSWLSTPRGLADLALFNNENEDLSTVTYVQAANLSDGGSIVVAKVEYNSPQAADLARFIEHSGKYTLVNNHSAQGLDELIAETVDLDYNTKYAALSAPDILQVGDTTLESSVNFTWGESLFNELDPEIIGGLTPYGETAYGPMYSGYATVENAVIQNKRYILKLADSSTMVYLSQKEFLADDGSVEASFNKDYSDFSQRTYTNGLLYSGCGYPNGDQVAELTVEQLTQVGITTSEDSLYTISDSGSEVLENAYTNYKVGRDYEGSEVELLSYDAFVALNPVLVWQDADGDYLLFMDADKQALAECGKPVVYLYPTAPTQVSVQVGAKVTVSEPVYAAGWNVLAQPNGMLTTADGQTYGSLYWEGKGYGSYPEITHGRVVERVNIESELRADLAAQGLNAQETRDFLDFWLSRMPNTPYVRLTWLGTGAMNHLAPLTISPTPDTTIRVFLDFTGQQTSDTTLTPQHLRSIPRTGFTVVEWGGLLLGK